MKNTNFHKNCLGSKKLTRIEGIFKWKSKEACVVDVGFYHGLYKSLLSIWKEGNQQKTFGILLFCRLALGSNILRSKKESDMATKKSRSSFGNLGLNPISDCMEVVTRTLGASLICQALEDAFLRSIFLVLFMWCLLIRTSCSLGTFHEHLGLKVPKRIKYVFL